MKDNTLESRLKRAQDGEDNEITSLLEEYTPLIKKYCYINNVFQEDLFSELQLASYLCFMRFKVDEEDWEKHLLDFQEK